MRNLLYLLFSLLFIQACSQGILGGNNSKNLEKLDKVYGKCDNPHRSYTTAQKKICEDKERAAGADGEMSESMNLTKMFEFYKNNEKNSGPIVQGLTVNPYLWRASLNLLDSYPLDIVDSQGGFISTRWIIDKNNPQQRCMIKILISSTELISNGVKVNLLCEQKQDEIWFNDNLTYSADEKNLTLKILELANQLKITEPV